MIDKTQFQFVIKSTRGNPDNVSLVKKKKMTTENEKNIYGSAEYRGKTFFLLIFWVFCKQSFFSVVWNIIYEV